MTNRIAISEIRTSRILEPGDDITALATHIHNSGLQVPVLVNQNIELIDGLRRMEAMRSLGNSVIDFVPVTLLGPALTWIERARVHGVEARPLSPRRIWELYRHIKPLIGVTRSQEMRGRSHGRGVHVDGRGRFLAATGIDSESYFQAVTQLYRMTLEEGLRGDLAKEAVDLVERGQLSVYMGLEYVRVRGKPSEVVKADDQVAMLDNVTSTLAGMAYGLGKLGPIDPAVPRDKLTEIAGELRTFRRTLHKLINQLEKEQGSQ